MVRGIDTFREYFKDFEANYVIIGGTACEIHEENYAQFPRATKDIDIILIVEALSHEFVERFWSFIRQGAYRQREKGTGGIGRLQHEYYRFIKPQVASYPMQIELFSRNLGLLDFPQDAVITPIPTDEDLSSLSAILMDDDYYHFTIQHSALEDGVHIASIESLICLKSKAFIDLTEKVQAREHVDKRNILKHKKDIFRLAAMLAPDSSYHVPHRLQEDVGRFCQLAEQELPNDDFFKAAGLPGLNAEELLQLIKTSFTDHD